MDLSKRENKVTPYAKQSNIKGRGYSAQDVIETSPGSWSLSMFRNSDDCEMGIFQIEATSKFRAFEIARKECVEEMRC